MILGSKVEEQTADLKASSTGTAHLFNITQSECNSYMNLTVRNDNILPVYCLEIWTKFMAVDFTK